jgi:hypothetical protein
MDAFVKQCIQCKKAIPESGRGRPQKFCSDKCRQAHRKIGSAAEHGLRYRTDRAKPKTVSEGFVLLDEIEPKNLSPKTDLRFERVNETTFKLTDGESTNVPASYGQWGGYRTTKAVAWVINIASGQWLARCRNEVAGPSSFKDAKANALAMARGAHGDYFIENPIHHLNGLQARLLDSDVEPGR